MVKKVILITGGARSGKSRYAEELALSLSENPVYVATAHIWDDEFRERVRIHQARRGPEWMNIEEEKELSRHDLTGHVAVIDCVTLWCTNYFFEQQVGHASQRDSVVGHASQRDNVVGHASQRDSVDSALEALKAEFDKFTAHDATYIFVTNEIGMGGVSENAVQRKFTDLQGWMNQYVASRADEVILMVSGIPIKVKSDK